MSGIGFQELIILMLIGLIVLGPERLPKVANQLGSWLGQARRMTRVMKRQLEDEINLEQNPNIKPQNREPSTKEDYSSTPRDDDTYSPVHEEGEIGTGVDDDEDDVDDDDVAVSSANGDDSDESEAETEEQAETEEPKPAKEAS